MFFLSSALHSNSKSPRAVVLTRLCLRRRNLSSETQRLELGPFQCNNTSEILKRKLVTHFTTSERNRPLAPEKLAPILPASVISLNFAIPKLRSAAPPLGGGSRTLPGSHSGGVCDVCFRRLSGRFLSLHDHGLK
ncbi:unnamed protein product [Rangifer tarandus platyrhynchus]|uniref:Uncharacterized protein n=1 Tax=Rangifer tarandus platyrhynchus TaxID=3082113 RepID=A0AC59ZX93_RANTA